MASMQKSREERAEAAAHRAADELHAARRDGLHQEPAAAVPSGGGGGGGGGMLGTVQESARSLLGAVRDKISGPGSGCGATAGEDKAWEGKGMTNAAAGKAAEAKGFAADKAEGAVEYAADVKDGARRALSGSAAARKGETNESAWQKGEDVRRRAAEKAEEARRRSAQHEPSSEEKGRSATENIYGSAASAAEAFRQKMTMPEDVVEQKRAEAAGTAAATATNTGGEAAAEDVMMRVKAADQMTGQAFNDVGMMGEEGTGMAAGDGDGGRGR